MGSRTALSKFPDPCCPQWAETNSTDGVAAPVQESTAGGCQWLDTQAAEKSRGIQICGGGGGRGHVALVGQQRGAPNPTLPCLLVLSETCRNTGKHTKLEEESISGHSSI